MNLRKFWNRPHTETLFSLSIARDLIRTFARQDNWHNLDLQHGDLGYGWLHYSYIRVLKPKRVLVIGSRFGYIPAICALACADNQKGMVDFVDAGYDEHHPDHWGGAGVWKKINKDYYFQKYNIAKYLQLHVQTTQQFQRQHLNKKWEYMYIDGDHSYAGVQLDFKKFWPKLSKGGILGLHDIHTQNLGRTDYGVKKFWRELKKTGIYNMIEFPGLCGVGFIQKEK